MKGRENRRRRASLRIWPDEPQTLLLRAALLAGDAALAAWGAWKAHGDFERLDNASHRLLPLIYRNLLDLGVDEPLLGRMKGVYRRAWYRNQMLFHTTAEVLRLLQMAGIDTMVLKGAALTLVYYGDHGLRMMNDVDVLVPTAARRHALQVLDGAGWMPGYFPLSALTEERLSVRQSWGFHDNENREFDLHWHVMASDVRDDADDVFWENAERLTVDGAPTLTLSPTDHVLHVCEHGMAPVAVPPVQWIADVMTLLGAAGDRVDWDRLAEEIGRRRLSLVMSEALSYLRREWHAPLPVGWLERLGASPVSDAEQREYKIRMEPPRWMGLYAVDWMRYLRYRLWQGDSNASRGLVRGFIRYDRALEGLGGAWQLPWWVLVKMRRWGRQAISGQRGWSG